MSTGFREKSEGLVGWEVTLCWAFGGQGGEPAQLKEAYPLASLPGHHQASSNSQKGSSLRSFLFPHKLLNPHPGNHPCLTLSHLCPIHPAGSLFTFSRICLLLTTCIGQTGPYHHPLSPRLLKQFLTGHSLKINVQLCHFSDQT